MPTLVDLGTPVITAERWTTALSPNPTNTGWNYIAASFTGINPDPVEWAVISNLTTTPTQALYDTATHNYPNILFDYNQGKNLRAGNGRIFFPLFANYFAYYDPTTAVVTGFGPFVESPPINPNASTIPYSASFDTAGLLYLATQESQFRPSCVVVIDTTTLAITVLGYVGSGALSYTTYGYHVAPDTGTATKYVYVAYGENPWQLWALELVSGTATKLYEVTSTGNIAFANIVGQGWVAQIHTDLGQPDDVYTQHWCLDGTLYDYTVGVPPPGGLARNVTPASNPLVNPPYLDTSGGTGIVGWSNTSGGPFTNVYYTVVYTAPVTLEVLVPTSDGVLIGAASYEGFVRYIAATNTATWFGAQSGDTIAQPLGLYVPTVGRIFLAGYPDGTLFNYNPAASWQTYPTQTNPTVPGFYGPSGNQKAGIKYAGDPNPPTTIGSSGNLAWSPGASSGGRLYCAGTRDRTGTGAGIGYWDHGTNVIAGTYASPLDTVQPQGLVALDTPGYIVMSTNTLSGIGPAPIYVFDHALDLVATQYPLDASIANIGPIFPTNDPDVICGAYINGGGTLSLYRWNVVTAELVESATTAYAGALDAVTISQVDGSVWIAIGNSVVCVDPSTLVTSIRQDITSIAPVSCMTFYGSELFMTSNATLWSTEEQMAAVERINSSGASDPSFVNTLVSGVGTAITLANGTRDGQQKEFAVSSGSGSITPANVYGGSVFTWTGQSALQLIWDATGGKWSILSMTSMSFS